MEGKNIFTTEEVQIIKKCLKEKSLAGSGDQKTIRYKMRKIGFYISDFSAKKDGFNLADFDALIRSGRVKVVKDGDVLVTTPAKRKDDAPANAVTAVNFPKATSADLKSILKLFKENGFDPATDNEKKVPNAPGNYILCLRSNSKLPHTEIKPTLRIFEGLEVIYTGIASKSLRNRDYRQHFCGNNAGRSTLRKSLGVLFSYDKIARDRDPATGKTKFKNVDEVKLTEWMCNNLLMYFLPTNDFNLVESALIDHFNPPLNLKSNRNAINRDFRQMLSQLRASIN